MDPTELPAHALSAAIHARQLSCRELMRATLARIAALNPVHKAIVSLRDEAELLREADARDAQLQRGEAMGWMHGLPQAIKDLALTAGLRTTLGSPLMKDFIPKEDGLMVARMKAAGAIVIGKTNTPEFGLGSHSFNELFGCTANAYDPAKTAGGSSGGAAVASGPANAMATGRVVGQKGRRQGANRSRVGHPARICNAACGLSGHNPAGRLVSAGHASLQRWPARECGRRAAPSLAR